MKGISKEFPWPGARCGWMEYYNRGADEQFERFCQTLDNAKMIEVCSTKLPQKAIPIIMGDERYQPYRIEKNKEIGQRSNIITDILNDIPYITFNPTNGAFYNTIIFREDVLKKGQHLKIENPEAAALLKSWEDAEPNMSLDKHFVYSLLAAEGVCVVPTSSFASELQGFRVTLLEENEELLKSTFGKIKKALMAYCESI